MKILICVALILFLVAGPIMSSDLEIYIQNRPLPCDPITKGDEIYVPGAVLQKLIKGEFTWNDRGEIQVQGALLPMEALKTSRGLLVPLKSISRALGYRISINSTTGIIDVYKVKAVEPMSPSAAASASVPSSPSPQPSPAPPETKKDLLTISETSFIPDSCATENGEVTRGYRVFANVFNGRSSPARNISARCVLKKADDQIIATRDESVGALGPGERKEVIFYIPSYEPMVVDRNLIKRELTVKGE